MGTPTTVKRRSKSANTSHYSKRNTRLRSISVDTYKVTVMTTSTNSLNTKENFTISKAFICGIINHQFLNISLNHNFACSHY